MNYRYDSCDSLMGQMKKSISKSHIVDFTNKNILKVTQLQSGNQI